MAVLAQLGGTTGGAETVPGLPSPPLVAHTLLESPWLLAAALAIAGVAFFYALNRQGKLRQGMWWLGGLVAAAGVLVGVASVVTTEREVLQARTREIVDATARADTAALGPMLGEQSYVGPFGGHYAGVRGREQVLDDVRKYLGDVVQLESYEVGPVQAVVDGPNVARTQVRVWVKMKKDAAMYGGSVGAWFRLGWRRDGDGPWRATSVTIMQIDGLGVNTRTE